MWNKDQNQPQPVPASTGPASGPATPSAAGPAFATTLIGESMRIKGEIRSGEELQLNGEVEGKMDLERGLTIGPKAKVVADIRAKEVIVHGSVKGNVDTSQRIVLRSGANLVGDVKTAGIVIEDGAYFKGGIDIARPVPTAAPAAHPAPAIKSAATANR